MTDRRAPWVRLRSTRLSAQIDPVGAQLSTLQDASGRDLLWNGDPAVWSGRAPLLFPIVGALAGGVFRLGKQIFALPRHGFARVSPFEILAHDDSSADLCLLASESTRRDYPFEFELRVRFALHEAKLEVRVRLSNLGDKPMPASFGFHPAFRWPLPYGHPRSDHFIEFSDDEAGYVRRLDGNGLLTPERHAVSIIDRKLSLVDSLFEHDALIFENVRSRYVRYGAAGGPRIEVNLRRAPFLGLWSKPGAGFICVEPWHGVADPQGYAGDFSEKPGMLMLEPGQPRDLGMEIALRD
jgi:galactose mutarotase-like enzyme